MIDLHMHSTFSTDGRDPPETMLERAAACGLRAVSFTEHGHMESLDCARGKAQSLGLEYVPGVEVGGTLHYEGRLIPVDILGYYMNPGEPRLQALRERSRKRSRAETAAFFAGLQVLQIPVTTDMVAERYPGRVCGWSIRLVLREEGLVSNRKEAMEVMARALEAASGLEARFAERPAPEPLENVIEALRVGGAVTIMAHPFWLTKPGRGGYDPEEVWRHIHAVRAIGVDGIESYNNGNDAGYAQEVLDYCQTEGLPSSGGSDSHAAAKIGRRPIPGMLLDSLQRFRRGETPWR